MASLLPYTGILGSQFAKHLLKRATLGASLDDIAAFENLTPAEALDQLTQIPAEAPLPPNDPLTGETWLAPIPGENNSGFDDLIKQFTGWHLEQMRREPISLSERMTWFLHTHLPIGHAVVRNAPAFYYQNALFRYYALGNFKTLFTKITVDNGMLRYIDNCLNDYASPNENYARELLELYSIGKGEQIGPEDYTNYTEQDVKEAARVISGFENDFTYTTLDEETGIPRGRIVTDGSNLAIKHDPDVKTFSAAFQNTVIQPNEIVDGYATEAAVWDELDQLMDMVFVQEETARFICRKLYRYFVYYDITDEVEQNIIVPLAQTFKDNNYEFIPVLKELLTSQHFYDMDNAQSDDDNTGALIKSPLELILGTYRSFGISFPEIDTNDTVQLELVYNKIYASLIDLVEKQGLPIYNPYDVAGYDPYYQYPGFNRLWISPNTIANRYIFANSLLSGIEDDNGVFHAKLDIVDWVVNSGHISNPAAPDTIVSTLCNLMLPNTLQDERYNFFLNDILLDTLSVENWEMEWSNYVSSGDDTAVRTQLENLIVAIMQSPEYQLY